MESRHSRCAETLNGLPKEPNHGNRIRNNTEKNSQNEGFTLLGKEIMTCGVRSTRQLKKIPENSGQTHAYDVYFTLVQRVMAGRSVLPSHMVNRKF